MTTKNYFSLPLSVEFTMSELYQIASALATESFNESSNGRYNTASAAWQLRDKVSMYIDHYDK